MGSYGAVLSPMPCFPPSSLFSPLHLRKPIERTLEREHSWMQWLLLGEQILGRRLEPCCVLSECGGVGCDRVD